jgi:hypothetical protein
MAENDPYRRKRLDALGRDLAATCAQVAEIGRATLRAQQKAKLALREAEQAVAASLQRIEAARQALRRTDQPPSP